MKSKFLPIITFVLIVFLSTSCSITKNNIHKAVNASIDLSALKAPGSSFPGGNIGLTVSGNAGFSMTEDVPEMKQDSGQVIRNARKNYYSFTEGIELTGKGWYTNSDGLKSTTNIYYLEVPATLNYNLRTDTDNIVRLGLGLYCAEALYGHFSTSDQGYGYSGRIEFNHGGGTSSLDIGLRAVVGYSLSKKVEVFLSYDFGLYNIQETYPGDNYDYFHNRSLGINVAYRFK